MSPRTLRAAMTETVNAFADMPENIAELGDLEGRLDELREANLAHHLELMEAAAQRGAAIIGFGELFTGPYFALSRNEVWFDLAEDARTGPSVSALCDAARLHGIAVVAPIFEKDAASGGRFNTAVIIDRDGRHRGLYRKTHIPEGNNESASFHETFYYEASDGGVSGSGGASDDPRFSPVFECAGTRIGVAICYDRHFEGVVGRLARAGAEIIFSPAVTFGAQSQRMWPLEFAVDAMRHRVYIGGSNRRGRESPWNIDFFGDSHFVGPSGRLKDASDHRNLVIADLDLSALTDVDASGWDLARDARDDIVE